MAMAASSRLGLCETNTLREHLEIVDNSVDPNRKLLEIKSRIQLNSYETLVAVAVAGTTAS